MLGRRLFCDCLALVPVVFLSYVAYASRAYAPNYQPIEYGAVNNAKIARYVEPVRWVKALKLSKEDTPVNPEKVREVGQKWLRAYHQGRLSSVPSVSFDDTTRDGVKQQIITARRELTGALATIAQTEARRGNKAAAAKDLAHALELSEIMKDCDLVSVSSTLMHQIKYLRALLGLGVVLEAEQRTAIARLDTFDVQRKRIGRMVTTAVRLEARSHDASTKRAEERISVYLTLVSDGSYNDRTRNQMRTMMAAVRGDTPGLLYTARTSWERAHELGNLRDRALGGNGGRFVSGDTMLALR